MPRPRYLAQPSVTGPQVVRVGDARYGVPTGSQTAAIRGATYVREPSGRLHVFTARGEAVIPARFVADILRLRFGATDADVAKAPPTPQTPAQRVPQPHPSEPRSDRRMARQRIRRKAAGA